MSALHTQGEVHGAVVADLALLHIRRRAEAFARRRAVVGTILNLINQGDALVAGARLNLTKLILTFVVPYAVATYGAVSYRLRAGSDRKTEDRR